MKTLPREDHHSVQLLYEASGFRFPLIEAVIGNVQRGAIFVDRLRDPQAALVVIPAGFACMLGAAADTDSAFNRDIAGLLQSGLAGGPDYLLWYAPPQYWQAWLGHFPPEVVRVRERIRLLFGEGNPGSPAKAQLPSGLKLNVLDRDLIPRADSLGLKLASRFWSSVDDFLENSFGFAVTGATGEVVSACYAAGIAGGLAEVDVATLESHRGQGLASHASHAFIHECLRRGLKPAWDCFAANEGSVRLAHRLGFAESSRYPFHTFKLPLPDRPS